MVPTFSVAKVHRETVSLIMKQLSVVMTINHFVYWIDQNVGYAREKSRENVIRALASIPLIDFINCDLRDLSTMAFKIRCFHAFFLIPQHLKREYNRRKKQTCSSSTFDAFKCGVGQAGNRCCRSSTLFEYFIWNWFRKLFKLIIGQRLPTTIQI